MTRICGLSALTLAVADMARSVQFYTELGFEVVHGGPDSEFTTLSAGSQSLNLIASKSHHGWGRAIFYVDDVDECHRQAYQAGLEPLFAPRDAEWGERYFHLKDPDGHELSFAVPLSD